MNNAKIDEIISLLEAKLQDCYTPEEGHWTGYLSSSALSTAVAVFALSLVDYAKHSSQIERGISWLADNQNDDGGWGDTPESPSNLSTTLLVLSALTRSPEHNQSSIRTNGENWVKTHIGSFKSNDVVSALLSNYGDDRTFSVPILTMCALSGLLGENDGIWKRIPQLPFELAVFPQSIYKFLKLSVVSYALPALIAIGLVRHKKSPTSNYILRILRNLIMNRTLSILNKIQPENGGFLEAPPLTGFVVMSLAAAGSKDSPVLEKAVGFLVSSMRSDGSWPIDTNLSTWLTTLSVKVLSSDTGTHVLDATQKSAIYERLRSKQYKTIHPYTNAAPGGWSWTDLPGGVPDADDTSGVLLALKHLVSDDDSVKSTIAAGISWLINLQNSDGGIPTFCKGWGRLPFDKSCPDITAHAFAAMLQWYNKMDNTLQNKMISSMRKMVDYLLNSQKQEGSWIPLWFGNQHSENKENPVYGTSRVINSLKKNDITSIIGCNNSLNNALAAGAQWLSTVQNQDGGWGGNIDTPSTIEETSVAISALLSCSETKETDTVSRGINWLVETISKTNNDAPLPSSPIGLYFASLWYDEKLYPIIFAIEALKKYFIQ